VSEPLVGILIGSESDRERLKGATDELDARGIAWELDVNDKGDRGKVDSSSGDISCHADPRLPVAKALERIVAFVLAMLARQGDCMESPLGQACVKTPNRFAGRAEQDRGFGFVEP